MTAHILIVDDDPLIGRLFQTALTKAGYRTTVVLSGPGALAFLADTPVDVMLLDIMMADMDGIDVVTKVRQDPVHHGLPIVLLTARADEASRQRGLGALFSTLAVVQQCSSHGPHPAGSYRRSQRCCVRL